MKNNFNIAETEEHIFRCLSNRISKPNCVDVFRDVLNQFNDYWNEMTKSFIELSGKEIENVTDPEEKRKLCNEIKNARSNMDAPKKRFLTDMTRLMDFWFQYTKDAEKCSKTTRNHMMDQGAFNPYYFFSDIYNEYNDGFTFVGEEDGLGSKMVKYMNITINALILSSKRKLGYNNTGKHKFNE